MYRAGRGLSEDDEEALADWQEMSDAHVVAFTAYREAYCTLARRLYYPSAADHLCSLAQQDAGGGAPPRLPERGQR